jgi:hypothetical protein
LFVGVYWSERPESREVVAVRIANFLAVIARYGDVLAKWFLKARSKRAAFAPIEIEPGSIAAALKVNRRDVGGEVVPELGFSLGLWNGRTASLSLTAGAFSPYVRNSVVLAFEDGEWANRDLLRKVLSAAIEAFDPDHGVVTSSEKLARVQVEHAWQAGWLTYARDGQVVEHEWEP